MWGWRALALTQHHLLNWLSINTPHLREERKRDRVLGERGIVGVSAHCWRGPQTYWPVGPYELPRARWMYPLSPQLVPHEFFTVQEAST